MTIVDVGEYETVTEHPILFSGAMVRAILAGRKTQTRRVITPRNSTLNGGPIRQDDEYWHKRLLFDQAVPRSKSNLMVALAGTRGAPPDPHLLVPDEEEGRQRVRAKIEAGDRLWVRESFCWFDEADWVGYRADGRMLRYDTVEDTDCPRVIEKDAMVVDPPAWRPSIHMPRWVCRLDLEVTDVRAERLCDITEADAAAEGAQHQNRPGMDVDIDGDAWHGAYRQAFERLWNQINARRGFPWSSNPWVWAFTFRVIDGEGGN